MVFVFVYRAKFLIFGQSFVVILVHERFMVYNPQTNLNSDFGGRRTVEEREGAWERKAMANGRRPFCHLSLRRHMAILGAEGLCPKDGHMPPRGDEVACGHWLPEIHLTSFSLNLFSLTFSNLKKTSAEIFSELCYLPNTISLSFLFGFEWFKLENFRLEVFYHLQVT